MRLEHRLDQKAQPAVPQPDYRLNNGQRLLVQYDQTHRVKSLTPVEAPQGHADWLTKAQRHTTKRMPCKRKFLLLKAGMPEPVSKVWQWKQTSCTSSVHWHHTAKDRTEPVLVAHHGTMDPHREGCCDNKGRPDETHGMTVHTVTKAVPPEQCCFS